MMMWLNKVLFGLLGLTLMLVMANASAATLSPRDYALIERAATLIEQQDYDTAYQQLEIAKNRVKDGLALALILQNLANIDLQRENYNQALAHLTQAYRLEKLPEPQQTRLQWTLAQLHCIESQWQPCADFVEGWLQVVPANEHQSSQYLLLAQANSQLDRWDKVVDPISKAIALTDTAPKNWYQLKVAALMALKRWSAAIATQKNLLSLYPDAADEWRRLVALQLNIDRSKGALASQRLGFEHGLLRDEKDYRLLAQLMIQQGLPFHGARILTEGMDAGAVARTADHLQLIASAWQIAREQERLVEVMVALNKMKPTLQRTEQLARLQMELERWGDAQQTLQQGLKNYQSSELSRLQLLLGITRIKLKTYGAAREALTAATQADSTRSSAASWLRYLERVEG